MAEFLRAFDLLSSTRQYGMGPNPIQLSQILAYIQLYGCGEETETFVEYLMRMDTAYLEAHAQKQERKRQQEKSNGK